MASELCLSLTKYFLFLFNLIFFLLGLSLLGLGFWIIFSESSFLIPAPGYLSLSLFSYLLVISGSVTLVLGFFGSLGALKEAKCMLATYFILLNVLLAAQIIGTVLLFTQRSVFESKLEGHVLGLIDSFEKNDSSLQPFKESLEFLQSHAHCCGWNGKDDWIVPPCSCYYQNSTVNVTAESLNSCCELFSNYTCVVYEQNCKHMIKVWLDTHIMIIFGVVIALAVVEICGTILSMYLYNWASMD
ncbi:leukocyte antigen CD37 [Tachysurus vachellii]|uniref:leukocyte antigen CD37 n=1 Tax=Tachysurus vachellii TaxID=175792 RepID=UPI00296AD086|nr:leukocyte antigen CD37 [Tachysurus vachellii]XP_060714414.1 leukocyte antigen CD37 [Tachysurus vachellii]